MALSGIVRCAKTGKPLQGVLMTDGKHIVKTDQNGFYTLPGWERARMLYANVLTNAHDDWYHAIEADRDVYDFALELAQSEGAHGFMHMSDTEINGETEADCAVWTAFVREKAKENRLAFIMHGGDIFGEIGLPKHYRIMNSRNMECPVRYCIGNHDFRGSGYGESLYEKFYGPTWYSFDCGNVHYVVTSIGHGDRPSGYVLEDQWNWLMEVWQLQPTISSFFYSTPLVAGDQLIVPAGNGIYVLNASNGAVRREITGCGVYLMHAGSGAGDTEAKKKACFDTSACPVLDGDVLYIGTVDNGVLALARDTFAVQQHYPVGKCLTYTSGYSRGDHGTVDGHILVEDTLRFAASDGYLYTYGKLNGLLLDRQWIGAPSFVAPVRFGGGIAVVDLRGNLTVFPQH